MRRLLRPGEQRLKANGGGSIGWKTQRDQEDFVYSSEDVKTPFQQAIFSQSKRVELSQYCTLGGEDRVAFNTNEKQISYRGNATYLDVFGQPHTTEWAVSCSAKDGVFYVPKGNSVT
jgi:hypothetical protein